VSVDGYGIPACRCDDRLIGALFIGECGTLPHRQRLAAEVPPTAGSLTSQRLFRHHENALRRYAPPIRRQVQPQLVDDRNGQRF
jgi:hypothetical protein